MNKQFFEKVLNNIGNKKVILITGASSSGKSYITKQMTEYLKIRGKMLHHFLPTTTIKV